MWNISTTAKSFWDSPLTFSVTWKGHGKVRSCKSWKRFTTPDNFHLLQTFPSPISHTDSVDTSTALLTCFNQYFTTEATVKLPQPGLSLQQQLGGFKNQCVWASRRKLKTPKADDSYRPVLTVYGLTQGGTATEAEGIAEGEDQKVTHWDC